jgi:predicted RNA-binding protein with TRAM domain
LREIEETTKRRFFLVGVEGEHLDHMRVLDQGTLEKVAPKLPVDVGQQIEVKLGEVGLHDPHAGTGRIEDVDIVVGDAAKLIGKKVTVTITAVTEGLAWAELVAPAEVPDEPLTAESEAEKPTRARRSPARKNADAADDVPAEDDSELASDDEPELESDSEPEPEPESEEELDAAAVTEGDEAVPAVPKKRTRRGSRGGKNRRKKPAVAAAAANGGEPAAEAEPADELESEPEPESEVVPQAEITRGADAGPAGPVIHLPERGLDGEEDDSSSSTPVKKKTRRGSRGGKNRRKQPAGATLATAEPETPADGEVPEGADAEATEIEVTEIEVADAPEPEVASSQPPSSENGDGDADWGYTPMSQWGLDE